MVRPLQRLRDIDRSRRDRLVAYCLTGLAGVVCVYAVVYNVMMARLEGDDSFSLLTTVQARSLNDDMEILLRVSNTDATRKALNAGADCALSVPRVSARMVAQELRGENVLAPASQVRFIRAAATPFAGSTLAESTIYETAGCRVIALEDDSITAPVDPGYRFTGDERLTLVGTDEAVQAFLKEQDVDHEEPA